MGKEGTKIIEAICQKCLQELNDNVTDNPPACIAYRDEPHHWLKLLKECPKLRSCLEQVIAESETIKSMWG